MTCCIFDIFHAIKPDYSYVTILTTQLSVNGFNAVSAVIFQTFPSLAEAQTENFVGAYICYALFYMRGKPF